MKIVDALLAAYGTLTVICPDGNQINLSQAQQEASKRAKKEPLAINKVKRPMSMAVRRRIARAQRKRWAQRRKEK